MRVYQVSVDFTFSGEFFIKAESREQAWEWVAKHCGMVKGSVQSTLPDDSVDWEFPTHPEKKIKSIKKLRPTNYENKTYHGGA